MHAEVTLSLLCLGDDHYKKKGRWNTTAAERKLLLAKIDGEAEGQLRADGTLSQDDFDKFCSNPENRQWVVEELPSSAHGLACFSLMKGAVKSFDENEDKVLDKKEWNKFMHYLGQLRVRYLHQMALADCRAYFGRGRGRQEAAVFTAGMDTECHVRKLVDARRESTRDDMQQNANFDKTFQFGCCLVQDWKGWRSDLYYYSANFHPLHGIWGCDANNRLERWDRLMSEISVLCYGAWMAVERWHMQHGGDQPAWLEEDFYFQLTCVTIPGMLLGNILFFLYTTPQWTVDESVADKEVIEKARWVSDVGDWLGNFVVVCLIVSLVIRVYRFELVNGDEIPTQIVVDMVMGRLNAYLISWVLMVGINFNPFIAWGSTKHDETCLGDWIGLGQWVMQKRKVCLTTLRSSTEAWNAGAGVGGASASLTDPLLG